MRYIFLNEDVESFATGSPLPQMITQPQNSLQHTAETAVISMKGFNCIT